MDENGVTYLEIKCEGPIKLFVTINRDHQCCS